MVVAFHFRGHFHIERISKLYRLDRTYNGGGLSFSWSLYIDISKLNRLVVAFHFRGHFHIECISKLYRLDRTYNGGGLSFSWSLSHRVYFKAI